MMTLEEKRRAIRHLLSERQPADAMAVYYAFYHPDAKVELVIYPGEAERASGYVAIARTGIDLFRPLLTMRLPANDMDAGVALIHKALTPGTAVILNIPIHYYPLIEALFDIQAEERLQLFVLDPKRFEPVINVLVTEATSHNGLPRFVIRSATSGSNEVVASATLNWQSLRYAEIAVNTASRYRQRGWGRSVVSAMVQHLLDNGRVPLYVAAENNQASIRLARRIGFVDNGVREIILQGTLRPHP